ncbi:MAG: T9SS type A sorting domain-containing protein [Ignavibacteria bacterium]
MIQGGVFRYTVPKNSIGYASTLYGNGTSKLFKTIDGGNNWLRLYSPGIFNEFREISVVSENELWMTDINVFSGGVYRSTNSGVSWENKYPPQLSGNPDRIYMVNSRIGFISNGNLSNSIFNKKTNSGESWFNLPAQGGWDDIYFKDSLTGWKCKISVNNIIKTTDGGNNWINVLSANTGNPNLIIQKFAVINDSQIWGIYFDSYYTFPNGTHRRVILKTTNNGVNWGYQLPDTNIRSLYDFIEFSDFLHGWCYSSRINGVHTITGGDTVTYPLTDISNINDILPENFKLKQNYPNPFNPRTKIGYEIQKSKNVLIKVFDIQGREVKTLINKKQPAGKYETEFDGSGFASGVYYYSLFLDGVKADVKKMMLIK